MQIRKAARFFFLFFLSLKAESNGEQNNSPWQLLAVTLPHFKISSFSHSYKAQEWLKKINKSRSGLKQLCHDFFLGPAVRLIIHPSTAAPMSHGTKRTYTVLQHKQDVLKPKQVAQKAFIHVGLCVCSRNKCVIGLRDHSWKDPWSGA